MEKTFARTEGRCSDCTLDFRLKRLQVLRFVARTEGTLCDVNRVKGLCSEQEVPLESNDQH